jgi:hypothetical protein
LAPSNETSAVKNYLEGLTSSTAINLETLGTEVETLTKKAQGAASIPTGAKSNTTTIIIVSVVVGIAVLGAAGGAYWYFSRKSKRAVRKSKRARH